MDDIYVLETDSTGVDDNVNHLVLKETDGISYSSFDGVIYVLKE